MTQVAIQIPDDLKPFIDHSVKTGAFNGAGDFLVNLLYNIKAQTESDLSEDLQVKFAALKTEIDLGVAQADRFDFVEFNAEDIIAENPTSPQK